MQNRIFSRRLRILYCVLFCAIGAACCTATPATAAEEPHPLSQDMRDELKSAQETRIAQATAKLEANPKSLDDYSRRGDAYFFLGEFGKSVSDYDQMVQLDSELDSSHWRRGIAYFYAGKFELAAGQFERYHSFDDVDRENGIWRYLSQVKSLGRDKAREGLLKYKKDDREPFPAVYELFAGKITPEMILKQIGDAQIDDSERQKRLFYAELYIGLNHAVENEPTKAVPHLRAATANAWPRKAGYGPHYMWQVGRLHYERLTK